MSLLHFSDINGGEINEKRNTKILSLEITSKRNFTLNRRFTGKSIQKRLIWNCSNRHRRPFHYPRQIHGSPDGTCWSWYSRFVAGEYLRDLTKKIFFQITWNGNMINCLTGDLFCSFNTKEFRWWTCLAKQRST